MTEKKRSTEILGHSLWGRGVAITFCKCHFSVLSNLIRSCLTAAVMDRRQNRGKAPNFVMLKDQQTKTPLCFKKRFFLIFIFSPLFSYLITLVHLKSFFPSISLYLPSRQHSFLPPATAKKKIYVEYSLQSPSSLTRSLQDILRLLYDNAVN